MSSRDRATIVGIDTGFSEKSTNLYGRGRTPRNTKCIDYAISSSFVSYFSFVTIVTRTTDSSTISVSRSFRFGRFIESELLSSLDKLLRGPRGEELNIFLLSRILSYFLHRLESSAFVSPRNSNSLRYLDIFSITISKRERVKEREGERTTISRIILK